MKIDGTLPASFLRCLSLKDRKELGVVASSSPEEALRKASVKSERDLQDMIANLFRLRRIEFFSQRMDKRTRGRVGQPDFLFAVEGKWEGRPGYWTRSWIPCAWEVKFGNGQLSEEQEKMHVRLSMPPNAWRVRVIRSVDQALAELREMGL